MLYITLLSGVHLSLIANNTLILSYKISQLNLKRLKKAHNVMNVGHYNLWSLPRHSPRCCLAWLVSNMILL